MGARTARGWASLSVFYADRSVRSVCSGSSRCFRKCSEDWAQRDENYFVFQLQDFVKLAAPAAVLLNLRDLQVSPRMSGKKSSLTR